MCCILHCVWPSPSTCFSLLERAQGDKISLQRQALIPIVSYTSRGGNIWVTLCSIITTFVASSAQMGLFLSRQSGLSRQHSEISLYNLKIILIGRTNIYLFCLWCSDLYCGKSSDPPIVIVLNISSLRGIKTWFIRAVRQLTTSRIGLPWDAHLMSSLICNSLCNWKCSQLLVAKRWKLFWVCIYL